MRLRKRGHACVRLEQAGVTLVIDPGSFSAPDSIDGATAVLITHEHVDHVVPDQLRAAAQATPDLRIWTNSAVADLLAGGGLHVETVANGDRFRVADTFDVLVVGEWHAVIHPDVPRVRKCAISSTPSSSTRATHSRHPNSPSIRCSCPSTHHGARFLR